MTDYEAASLAAQQAALWIAAVSAIGACVSAAAATVAAVGIWRGIRAMVDANKERAVIVDRQREADDKRHAEAMAKADQRHAEAMADGARRHEENMTALKAVIAGLERQTASLEAVVEQAAPAKAEE